ncbi:MAG: DUF3417 domain-containing protein, partial [Planctomycetota bacterium]
MTPKALEKRLRALALDLRWTWCPSAQALFAAIDPLQWEATHHAPLEVLRRAPVERIESCAADERFHALLDAAHARRLAPPTRRLTPELLAALRDELRSTNALRKWPCKSLWLADLTGGDHPPHVAQRARVLVPNCSAPYTTCGVQRDLCEQS